MVLFKSTIPGKSKSPQSLNIHKQNTAYLDACTLQINIVTGTLQLSFIMKISLLRQHCQIAGKCEKDKNQHFLASLNALINPIRRQCKIAKC